MPCGRDQGMMGCRAGRIAMFPGKKTEDLDVKDGFVFEKANPDNRKA